jgi:uncharacterized 2Fe-2S/4Fe-4S cluster protein (DUF4445 family)
MAVKNHSVTFLPENKTIRVEHLKTIFETIGEQNPEGIQLFFSCGAEGICQKCKVRSLQAMGPLTATEKGCLTDAELVRGIRLACQARVVQDSQVEIQYKRPFTIALTDEAIDIQGRARLQKLLSAPGDDGGPPDPAALLEAALAAGLRVSAEVLEVQAADCLVQNDGEHAPLWTAVFLDERLIALEPGDTSAALYAVAVDLGTNTLEVSLVDVARSRKIGLVTDSNPQIELGDTYAARLAMAEEDAFNLDVLNEEIILRIDVLIHELCAACGVSPEQVYEILVAGSTGMLHLFLMRAPDLLYRAADSGGRLTAGQLDLHSTAQAGITLLPVINVNTGADITAAILATRLHRSTETSLLLDLGGTTKAVLYHRGRLFVSVVDRTAVLDGSGLYCGMRPETGAVSGVCLGDTGDLNVSVIGESLARGVCGSGLLSLAACLLEAGMLDETGDFVLEPNRCPALLRNRLTTVAGEPAVVLFSDSGEFSTDIHVTGTDICILLEARRRIAAMLENLCARAGSGLGEISRMFLSGALGGSVSGHVLGALGFVPPGLADRAVFIGNASKQGVQLALLDKTIADDAVELAQSVVFIPYP